MDDDTTEPDWIKYLYVPLGVWAALLPLWLHHSTITSMVISIALGGAIVVLGAVSCTPADEPD